MKKKFVTTLILGVALVCGLFYLVININPGSLNPLKNNPLKDSGATNFTECVAEGGDVMTIYPAICTSKNGKSFTEDIGIDTSKLDQITIQSPLPSDSVTSPLIVEGEARGTWFFEANFPITIVDDNGKVLGTSYATALEDWMTQEFVRYTSTINFDKSTTSKGKLILHKANASDLEDNEDSLVVPIYFYAELDR